MRSYLDETGVDPPDSRLVTELVAAVNQINYNQVRAKAKERSGGLEIQTP